MKNTVSLTNLILKIAPSSKPITLSLLVIDASYSMSRFGTATPEAVNTYLDILRNDTAHEHYCGIVTFGKESRLVLQPKHVNVIGKFDDYNADGMGTLLWRTVKQTISNLLKQLVTLDPTTLENMRVVIGVFSDGEDNQSDRKDYPDALIGYAAKALYFDWTLQAFGIGVDGRKLARDMGFPVDIAVTVPATAKGVSDSMTSFGQTTTASN